MNVATPHPMIGRPRRRAALAGVVLVLLVTSGVTPGVATSPAHACSCAVEPIGDLARDAEVVVEGRVARVDRPSVNSPSTEPMTYTIEVSRVWRGPSDGRPLVVETASSGASCGLDIIAEGQQVLMVASMEQGRLTTNLCNGSGPATPDRITEVVATFGPGQHVAPQRADAPNSSPVPDSAPRPDSAGATRIAAAAVTVVGLAAMAVAVAIVVRYRRPPVGG